MTDTKPPKAVVVGVQTPEISDDSFESSLVELTRLADTLGIEVVGRITQRRAALSPTVLGEGKLGELADFTGGIGEVPTYSAPGKKKDDRAPRAADDEPRANVVLVDHDLTPSQLRNLEKATEAQVLDRSMVILSIFQRHARTREARMQVEIARLAYEAPRLREQNAGQDRQRGGIGGKGAGESSLELDRRRIRDRISELRGELEEISRDAGTRRGRRAEANTVALVGYTNAGKSSLMRALTGDEVYVADRLFATLDTTVRALHPETKPRILVSDTVGFIKKLPHDLVASFRSTLDEAREARLLLHVVDASDPAFRDQLAVTEHVLSEIEAGQNPRRLVLNKIDRVDDATRDALIEEFPDAWVVSAKTPSSVAWLRERIIEAFESGYEEAELLIPYGAQKLVHELHENGRVLGERFEEAGVHIRVRAPAAFIENVRLRLAPNE